MTALHDHLIHWVLGKRLKGVNECGYHHTNHFCVNGEFMDNTSTCDRSWPLARSPIGGEPDGLYDTVT